MLKLVSQFDNEKSKLSLATPTCGCCCCCCCCCLVSTIATTSLTARSFGKFLSEDIESPNKEKRYPVSAMAFGFFAPIAGTLLGLMIYLLLTEFEYFAANYIWIMLACIVYFFFMIKVLNKSKNKLGGIIKRTIVSSIALAGLIVAEAFVALWIISANLLSIYLIIAIIIDIAFLINLFSSKSANDSTSNNIISTTEVTSDTVKNVEITSNDAEENK